MVFSSFPSIYLDHPNLQQFQQEHEQHHRVVGSGVENCQIQQRPPHPTAAVPVGTAAGGAGGGGVVGGAPLFGGSSIRPGSMVDRARVAKLPLPEAGLKCPRCDSSNTKFCYFNNYNLSQPRHFCKTCRRYWTRGGALRNVPVGGGCRRNKKTKSSSATTSSKTSNEQKQQHEMGANNNNTDMSMTSSTGMQLPFIAALHNLNQYAAVAGGGHMGFSLGAEAWRLPTAIRGGGYEPSLTNTNLFSFQEINIGNETSSNPMIGDDDDQQLIGNFGTSSSNVKSEENPAMNSTKQFHISSDNIGQFWNNGNPWSSSSTSHLL